jgi:hypothetical protein
MATNDLLVGYTRRFSGPVDATATFPTLSALQSYASSDPTAYAGQVCAVTGTNTVYVINTDKTISAVGSGSGGGGGSYDQSLNTTDSVKFIDATIGKTGAAENNNSFLEFYIGNKPNNNGFNTAGIFSSGISFYYDCDARQAIVEYDPFSSWPLKFPQSICGGTSGNWQLNPDGSASFSNGFLSISTEGALNWNASGAYIGVGGNALFQGLQVTGGNPTSLDGGLIGTDGGGNFSVGGCNLHQDGSAYLANGYSTINASGDGYFQGILKGYGGVGGGPTTPYLGGGHINEMCAPNGTLTPLLVAGGSGLIEFWDSSDSPNYYSAFGLAVPGNSSGPDFHISSYIGGWHSVFDVNCDQGGFTTTPVSRPTNPSAGRIYFDADDSHFYGFNGTSWVQLDH